MPNYCVNTQAQDNGDHEVHDLTSGACEHLPALEHRKALGWHADCNAAVKEAKKSYKQSNGCYHCCRPCHTS